MGHFRVTSKTFKLMYQCMADMSHDWRHICLANSFKWPEAWHFAQLFIVSTRIYLAPKICQTLEMQCLFWNPMLSSFPHSFPSLSLGLFVTLGTKGWLQAAVQFMVYYQSCFRQGSSLALFDSFIYSFLSPKPTPVPLRAKEPILMWSMPLL